MKVLNRTEDMCSYHRALENAEVYVENIFCFFTHFLTRDMERCLLMDKTIYFCRPILLITSHTAFAWRHASSALQFPVSWSPRVFQCVAIKRWFLFTVFNEGAGMF